MSASRFAATALCSLAVALAAADAASAGAILPGFSSSTLAPNDDGSTGFESFGFTINFFGNLRTGGYVNNNGNVTLDFPLSTYTPFDLTSTGQEILAPFFADVDTRFAGDAVTYGTGLVGTQSAFGVNWLNVDYYSSSTSHTNRNYFQLVIIDRSDISAGDFDFEFNIDQIQWETGQASGGDANGLGGSSARVGWSNGSGDPGTFYELPGSAVNGAFLDGGPAATELRSNSLNSDVDGRYLFEVRNGIVQSPSVPEPTSIAIWSLIAVGGVGYSWLRRKRGPSV